MPSLSTMPKLPLIRIFGEYSHPAARKVPFHPNSLRRWRDWALVDNGMFFFRDRSAPHPVLRFFDFAKASVRDVTKLEKPGEWISAPADGKFVSYDQFDHEESNMMLLENFR